MKRSFNGTIVAALALTMTAFADKDAPFKANPAASYPNKQTVENVTLAAMAYDSEALTRTAFGKVNPNRHGILPILLVIQNGTGKSLDLTGLRLEYVTPRGGRVAATPAAEVPYSQGPGRPKYDAGGPIPGGGPRISRKKNPLADGSIDVRAFAARLLPNGEEASGFFYFETGFQPGSQLYVTGIREAGSGKEIFYAEIPLSH
jgi:hypothetical protein